MTFIHAGPRGPAASPLRRGLTAPAFAAYVGASALALSLLVGCGSGGDNAAPVASPSAAAPVPATTEGRLLPARQGVVVVEYAADGSELQRSAPSDSEGWFVFSVPLRGLRVATAPEPGAGATPVHRSARLGAGRGVLEVTPLTALFDHQLQANVLVSDAAGLVAAELSSACSAAAPAGADPGWLGDRPLTGPLRDWLFAAADAYLEALRGIGLAPDRPQGDFFEVFRLHGDVLGELCALARGTREAARLAQLRAALANDLGRALRDDDAPAFDAALAQSLRQVLEALGAQVQSLHYPELNAMLGAGPAPWSPRAHEMVGSLLQAHFRARLSASGKTASTMATVPQPSLSVDGQLQWGLYSEAPIAGLAAPARGFVVRNGGSVDRIVSLQLNGIRIAHLRGLMDDLLRIPMAAPDEPLHRRAWRYVVAMHRHATPLSVGIFMHRPELYLHSVGQGLCDDAASALYHLLTALGTTARVVHLGGHIVVEVLHGGRWELYDPDYGVYYLDRQGRVAGVADLERDPSLITDPSAPVLPRDHAAYSEGLSAYYSSTQDNGIDSFHLQAALLEYEPQFSVPAGGYLAIDPGAETRLSGIDGSTVLDNASVRLWFPPGYVGTVQLPLVLSGLAGTGRVTLVDRVHVEVDALLSDWLLSWFRSAPVAPVQGVHIEGVGPGGLTLTMLLHPSLVRATPRAALGVVAADLRGLWLEGGDMVAR